MSNGKSIKKRTIKVSKKDVEQNERLIYPNNPSFCFRPVTANKTHNFEYFKSDKHTELVVRQALDDVITYLSEREWVRIILGKKDGLGGYETLDYPRLKFSPKNFPISDDEKISVVRFGNGDAYRLIGYWKDPIFYVFGYDFNFSSYDH